MQSSPRHPIKSCIDSARIHVGFYKKEALVREEIRQKTFVLFRALMQFFRNYMWTMFCFALHLIRKYIRLVFLWLENISTFSAFSRTSWCEWSFNNFMLTVNCIHTCIYVIWHLCFVFLLLRVCARILTCIYVIDKSIMTVDWPKVTIASIRIRTPLSLREGNVATTRDMIEALLSLFEGISNKDRKLFVQCLVLKYCGV